MVVGLGGASKYVGGGVEQDTAIVPLAPWRVGNSETVGGTREPGLGEGGGHGTAEERVLQGIIWLHPCVGVIVQHAEDEIFKLAIVTGAVARLSLADSPRAPSLHPENVIQ